MSVIAWDGRIIASDRAMTSGNTMTRCTKMRRISTRLFGECVVGITGDLVHFGPLIEWLIAGADPDSYPSFQTPDQGSNLLLVRQPGELFLFTSQPIPVELGDPGPYAIGSGRDFAIGAMAAGRTAVQAVHIANAYDSSCGFGAQAFDMQTLEEIQ